MNILQEWIEKMREDVNQENSMIIQAFGNFTGLLFKVLILCGVPFLIYTFLQFKDLL